MLTLNVQNEWGQLKKVALGRPFNIQTPQVLKEVEEDLLEIEKIFTSLGVEICNPPITIESNLRIRNYVLIIKDKVVVSPNILNKRLFNIENVIRLNYDILYMASDTDSKAASQYLQNWLRENISENYNVHLAENINSYDIDDTFIFLKEGLVLTNPSKVNIHNMPHLLRNWNVLNAPEPYKISKSSDLSWIGMSIFSINEKLVMVEEHQLMLMKLLKKIGIESIPIRLRHMNTFGCGLRGITLDIERE